MNKIICCFCIIFFIKKVIAQNNNPILQTPCATAYQGTAGNFIISYTIGEMVLVNTLDKKNGLLITQGITQPIIPYTKDVDNTFNEGDITVFPNPTPNIFAVQINLLLMGKISLQLFDAAGKKIIEDEISVLTFQTNKYDLSKYSSGMYILKLEYKSQDGTQIKKGKYKIIKMP